MVGTRRQKRGVPTTFFPCAINAVLGMVGMVGTAKGVMRARTRACAQARVRTRAHGWGRKVPTMPTMPTTALIPQSN